MGKGTELWDDSALINAFDHAMATYKEMHSKGDRTGNDLVVEKEEGQGEPEDKNNVFSSDTLETYVAHDNAEMTIEDSYIQENTVGTEIHAPTSDLCSSSFACVDEKTYSFTDQQSLDYDQLLKQYYELEDQRQKVLQQLHQANYWNYQTPEQTSSCQLPLLSGYNASEHGLQIPCPSCSCHCIAIPLIPSPCTVGGLCAGGYSCPLQLACCSGSQTNQVPGAPVQNGQHSTTAGSLTAADQINCSRADDSTVRVGMLAMERAIDSMKLGVNETSNSSEGKRVKDASTGISDSTSSQCISSGSDLTTVLNSWYLAGFHTGRYMSEQSKKNSQ